LSSVLPHVLVLFDRQHTPCRDLVPVLVVACLHLSSCFFVFFSLSNRLLERRSFAVSASSLSAVLSSERVIVVGRDCVVGSERRVVVVGSERGSRVVSSERRVVVVGTVVVLLEETISLSIDQSHASCTNVIYLT
jgi:hypothetical protein